MLTLKSVSGDDYQNQNHHNRYINGFTQRRYNSRWLAMELRIFALSRQYYVCAHNIITPPAVNITYIKSISNELDITFHVLVSQLSGNCDVINNRLWHQLQNVTRASEKRCWCVKIVFSFVVYGSVCRVRNTIMYAPSWPICYLVYFGL